MRFQAWISCQMAAEGLPVVIQLSLSAIEYPVCRRWSKREKPAAM